MVLVRAGRLAGADLAGTCYLLEAKKNPKDREKDEVEDGKDDDEVGDNDYILSLTLMIAISINSQFNTCN